VNYSLDKNEKITMDCQGNEVFVSDELYLENGNHEVVFYAEDEAGNKANKTVDFTVKESENNGNGDSGTEDINENNICYKIINGKCLTYEDYLYYKQHTEKNPTYLNQTEIDSGDNEEGKEFDINWLKVVFWILFIGVVILFLLLIRYAWKAAYLSTKN